MAALYEQTLKDFKEGSIVTGKVLEIRNNEVLIDIGYKSEGVVSANEFRDMDEVAIGDELNVLLAQIEDDNGMVVLSKQQADEKIQWERVLSSFGEGSVIEGVVKTRVRGGLIVDVDGIEAFLPGSQIDVIPVHNTDALLNNRYEFKILKISEERRNIILSRRELIEERLRSKRKELMESLEVGQRIAGKAKNITDFGVFVDLNGMDGLLHITDMSWGRIRHPSEMVNVGDEIEVVILDIDRDRERVSLGLKQSQPNPWEDIGARYPVGSRLRGKVVNLVPYGAFVEIEKGVEGLVHVSEMSWTKRIARASDVVQVGDECDVVVLGVNKEEQKIALGMRQTEDNPWDTVQARYPVGSRVHGKIRNFTSYGAFVELEDGIDGMIHVSDMSWTRKVNHPSEVLAKDEQVDAVVLEVDPSNSRISLGLKQAAEDPWTSVVSKFKVGDRVSGKVTKVASFGAFVDIGEGVDGLVHISQLSEGHVERVKDVLDVGADVEARIVRIDRAERRVGLSIKAGEIPDDEFEAQKEDGLEGLRPGEHMVDLAGAFDEALGLSSSTEEWTPGGSDEAAQAPAEEPEVSEPAAEETPAEEAPEAPAEEAAVEETAVEEAPVEAEAEPEAEAEAEEEPKK
ncbi:MAG: 30S ribosomal protein S1 [Verrucomicrobia bacterium]|nr:30S ribosomal protein S1 [Verrucomicrobiota bacterium]MBT7067756.1 30S ribosomal protein S1 [Verrucomicrobiota bacterium]MBT7702325.1 30S ribosomal protein S1 [Verrucomicrobiota bacterium]